MDKDKHKERTLIRTCTRKDTHATNLLSYPRTLHVCSSRLFAAPAVRSSDSIAVASRFSIAVGTVFGNATLMAADNSSAPS